MALTPRQTRLYTDVCDLWAPTAPTDANSAVLTDEWTRVAQNVPCHFEIRPNVDSPGVFGRFNEDNLFVMDVLHLDEHQRIESDYIVRNNTLDPDGSATENTGLFWRVRGPARNISQRRTRRAQKRQVYIYLEKAPPTDVANAY